MNTYIPRLLKRSRTFAQFEHANVENQESQEALDEEVDTTSKRVRVDGPNKRITCTKYPCKFEMGHVFDNMSQFEKHIARIHTNVCLDCGRNFPSERWLELHIHEVHNPLRRVQFNKGEATYTCVVQRCEKMFFTHDERNKHCREEHGFSKKFDFRIIRWGITSGHQRISQQQPSQPRRAYSMPVRRKDKDVQEDDLMVNLPGYDTEHDTDMDNGGKGVDESQTNDADEDEAKPHSREQMDQSGVSVAQTLDVENLTKQMSSLSFVPSSVQRKQNTKKQKGLKA